MRYGLFWWRWPQEDPRIGPVHFANGIKGQRIYVLPKHGIIIAVSGALRGWPPERSIQNFRQLADVPEFNASEVDRKSIMHYSLPPWLFKGGEKSPCVVATNYQLSDRDKEFIGRVYPKAPQVVATAPETATTRSSRPSAQARLVEEYRKALREAGVEPAKVESLAREFSASLARP